MLTLEEKIQEARDKMNDLQERKWCQECFIRTQKELALLLEEKNNLDQWVHLFVWS